MKLINRRRQCVLRTSVRILLASIFFLSISSSVSCQNQSRVERDTTLIAPPAIDGVLVVKPRMLPSVIIDGISNAADTSVIADSLAASFVHHHALALRGIVILLDAGHGGTQDGALYDSIAEKNVNLAVTFKLKARLELLGASVCMTRTSDSDLSLQARVDKSIQLRPDIFVSVHSNANRHTSIDGIETYYYSKRSAVLAKTLLKSISAGLSETANWMKQEGLFVLHHNIVPCSLVEIGYLSNTRTNKLLNSGDYQERVAESIAHGIFNYFQLPDAARGALPGAKAIPVKHKKTRTVKHHH